MLRLKPVGFSNRELIDPYVRMIAINTAAYE